MTITEFLLARIAEDEEGEQAWVADMSLSQPIEWLPGARMPPTPRMLADCKAKRLIVEDVAEVELTRDQIDYTQGDPDYDDVMGPLRDVLRSLATVYSDHPDYQEEWKP